MANLFYKANTIKKYYKNISLEEAKSLGLEQIVLELTLRKKSLKNNEHYSIYVFEYLDSVEYEGITTIEKNIKVAVIQYLQNTDVVTAIKTKKIRRYL